MADSDKKTKPALVDLGGLHDKPPKASVFDLDKLDTLGLLELRAKIEEKLPIKSLEDVNLVRESLTQLQMAKSLQAAANERESGVPMNQRSQVQNSLSGIITTLAKVQMDLYTSERIKRVQSAVVKVVKQLPKASQELFFDMLENELKAAETAEAEAT